MVSLYIVTAIGFTVSYFLNAEKTIKGFIIALLLGSITMIPGFIAYPIAKVLIEKGVSYTVVAGLVTSLMLVGIVTFPLEKKYFGSKATILRNIMSFFISGLIALIMGIFYGEVFI